MITRSWDREKAELSKVKVAPGFRKRLDGAKYTSQLISTKINVARRGGVGKTFSLSLFRTRYEKLFFAISSLLSLCGKRRVGRQKYRAEIDWRNALFFLPLRSYFSRSVLGDRRQLCKYAIKTLKRIHRMSWEILGPKPINRCWNWDDFQGHEFSLMSR